MILSVEYYRARTGDTTSAASAIEEQLPIAESLFREHLGRELEHNTYVEKVKVWQSGFVYPAAVPVTSASASSNENSPDIEIYDEASLRYVNPDDRNVPFWNDSSSTREAYEAQRPYATITYSGGFTEATMPPKLGQAICLVAKAMINSDPTLALAAGATSLRVGDVAVSYGSNAAEKALNFYYPGVSVLVRGYKLGRL